MTVDVETKQAQPDSQRALHYQIDAEMRDEVRALREDCTELRLLIHQVMAFQEQYGETIKTASTLIHAGIAMRTIAAASIVMLSMVGGINIAYETIRKWMGHP